MNCIFFSRDSKSPSEEKDDCELSELSDSEFSELPLSTVIGRRVGVEGTSWAGVSGTDRLPNGVETGVAGGGPIRGVAAGVGRGGGRGVER